MAPCVLSALAAAAAMMETPTQPDSLDPAAHPAAVVVAGNARFTVLTPAMIRMEWSPDAVFEDRPSMVFINRRLDVLVFETTREDGWRTIRTEELTLRYHEGASPREGIPEGQGARKDSRTSAGEDSRTSPRFTADNLAVEFTLNGKRVTWRPGMPDSGNLRGTTRTLDGVSGGEGLEPGLLSRDGWVVVDDSKQLVLERRLHVQASEMTGSLLVYEPTWPAPRAKDALDWYFLGYGHDYARALKDYTRIAGRIPLPPRFVFGAWWSRYWPYSDAELRDLVEQFRQHDVPLDVLVIDMDWHLDGWTGYTWNPKYFPDPDGFLKWVKSQGLRTTLNLHPADGVGKHEAAFDSVARHMGLDPAKVDKVPFDCTDPAYMGAYFKDLHHPLERQGIDFWWIDWQQGTTSKIEGLDPLRWLNHLHWHDMDRTERGGKRPLIMSRWPGLGGHRYPIGFSGDTYCNWESLAFQPCFTSTAGNVGFAYWSHDVGGHMPGVVDPELYARWIQSAVFMPTLRTHTTRNKDAERRIWAFPDEVFRVAREAFHLRYSLIPYIYTAARQCYDTGLPLCRPLYYAWPELDAAYTHGGQYLFGDDLMVAPVMSPRQRISFCAGVRIWIPPGEWVSWFTGRSYSGPTEVSMLVDQRQIPVFVRAGGIVPTMPKMNRTNDRPVDPLILHIFPGESVEGAARVYEDDGETVGYQRGECAWTPVVFRRVDGKHHITIGPVEGSFPNMLRQRCYEIWLHSVWPAESIGVNGAEVLPANQGHPDGWSYDARTFTLVIPIGATPVDQMIEVAVTPLPTAPDEAILHGGLRQKAEILAGCVFALTLLPERDNSLDRWRECARKVANSELEAPPIEETVRFVQDAPQILKSLAKHADAKPQRYAGPPRFLANALGLAAFVHANIAENRAGAIQVEIEAWASLPLDRSSKFDGRIQLATPAHWSMLGKSSITATNCPADTVFGMPLVLVPKSEPRVEILRAHIAIKQNDVEFAVPIEQVILPSIDKWWIIGPFVDPAGKGLDAVFPPEREIDLRAGYPASAPSVDRKPPLASAASVLSWQRHARTIAAGDDPTAEFYVDLRKLLGEAQSGAVAYGLAFLHVDEATDASLALGSDDGVSVWLNGKEMHRNTAPRAYLSKQDRIPIELQAGVNMLLVKVGQVGGGWGFAAHVETLDGHAMPEVTTRFEN